MFKEYMKKVRDLGLHEKCYILVGVGPMASAKTAKWIRSNVPGIHIPDSVIKRLEGAQDQKKEGKQLCIDIINEVKDIEGVIRRSRHGLSPRRICREIVHESGVLKGRTPWKRRPASEMRELVDQMQEDAAASPEAERGNEHAAAVGGQLATTDHNDIKKSLIAWNRRGRSHDPHHRRIRHSRNHHRLRPALLRDRRADQPDRPQEAGCRNDRRQF